MSNFLAMEQYIRKSEVKEEIRKYIKSAEAFLKYHHNKKDRLCYSIEDQRLTMCELLSFIDTLEVKEVDLEKEIATQYESNYEDYLTYEEFADIAKHFYELGLNAQKGE